MKEFLNDVFCIKRIQPCQFLNIILQVFFSSYCAIQQNKIQKVWMKTCFCIYIYHDHKLYLQQNSQFWGADLICSHQQLTTILPKGISRGLQRQRTIVPSNKWEIEAQ